MICRLCPLNPILLETELGPNSEGIVNTKAREISFSEQKHFLHRSQQ